MVIGKRTALDGHGVSPASPSARISAPAPVIGARGSAALAALCIAALAGPSVQAASKPPLFLRSCTITPPDPAPVFSLPAAPKPAAASDDEDDDAEDDDEDDESPRGFVSPGTGTCIAVSGTVNAGVQHDGYRANAPARMTGLVPQNAISSPLSTTFRIETGQMLAEGRYLASAFEFSVDATSESSELTMSEASVTFGAFAFGLASSRFDFWTGDDFAFIGRIPNRTVALIGYERQLTDELGLSLSLEDVDADRRTVVPPTGKRFPDGVVRLLYEQDGLTLHGGVAVRDVQGASGSYRVGRAAILGATWERKLLDRPLTLTAQIAGAVNAAPYLGSKLDQRTAFSVLAGDPTTRGWSGVVALGREWTDEWSTNAYVSRYRLSVPNPSGLAGRIQIDRVAANLIWAPVDGLRLGLEGSVAWQKLELAGNARATSLSGRQSSAQLFVERTF